MWCSCRKSWVCIDSVLNIAGVFHHKLLSGGWNLKIELNVCLEIQGNPPLLEKWQISRRRSIWGKTLKDKHWQTSLLRRARGGRFTLGAVSSTFGLFSISHNPSLKPFLLLGLAYFSLLGWYGKISFGPRNALFERKKKKKNQNYAICNCQMKQPQANKTRQVIFKCSRFQFKVKLYLTII